MAFGDRLNQNDGMMGELGCGHPDVRVGEKCPLCGQVLPGSPNSCKEHADMLPGEKCPICDWIIPCPHCGVAGNINDKGCMNCGWGAPVEGMGV